MKHCESLMSMPPTLLTGGAARFSVPDLLHRGLLHRGLLRRGPLRAPGVGAADRAGEVHRDAGGDVFGGAVVAGPVGAGALADEFGEAGAERAQRGTAD